ncbi:pig-V [Schizosaccharomyces japonicus yFS275]|uniref:GPI mannosyltransferase 2 n=1 Tax=Schizosaccharomyces japonicus (strain yFS275 / FY16936) TaxID=402676 RepID=B6JV88_SCHJY|nr:pig-V [Schizosaccharomyces japonicus yFS275]EEB05289.1 pig-V [Schizosaccharomyces japonicus yFS275]
MKSKELRPPETNIRKSENNVREQNGGNQIERISYFPVFKLFCFWTLLLQAISVMFSKLLAFDDSSALLLKQNPFPGRNQLIETLFNAFIRWDSIYFVDMAMHGRKYEQEWAFSQVWPALMRKVAFFTDDMALVGVIGCYVAVAFHGMALYCLLKTTERVFTSKRFAVITGILYVLSPSGIFCSVAFTEPLFAALAFLGMLLLTYDQSILAAVCWSASVTIRSNGLLFCLFFGIRLLAGLCTYFGSQRSHFAEKQILRNAICILIVMTPFLRSQWQAYQEFCPGATWCENVFPFIYTAVQRKYWDVGFLRYWTPNNIPNFGLALLTIIPLIIAIIVHVRYSLLGSLFMVSQWLLAAMLLYVGIFQMHVQVLNRLSSGIPLLYWGIAYGLMQPKTTKLYKMCLVVQAAWIIYTVIQAGLYGSFMPPA